MELDPPPAPGSLCAQNLVLFQVRLRSYRELGEEHLFAYSDPPYIRCRKQFVRIYGAQKEAPGIASPIYRYERL